MEFKYGKLGENISRGYGPCIGTTQMTSAWGNCSSSDAGWSRTPLSKEDIRKNTSRRFHDEIAQGVTSVGIQGHVPCWQGCGIGISQWNWLRHSTEASSGKSICFGWTCKEFEKIQKQLMILLRNSQTDHDPKKIPAEFVEWMHQILFQIKRPPKRLPEACGMVAIRLTRPFGICWLYNVLPVVLGIWRWYNPI